MTAGTVLRVGLAAGRLCQHGSHRHSAVIGKDTRLSGYMLEPALTAGLTAAGMDVILVGPVPTPAIAMLTRSLRADLGLMISASHNPYQDNGIKLFGADGYKLSDDMESEIERLVFGDIDSDLAVPAELGRARRLNDVEGRYIEFVKNTFPRKHRLDGLKIVIDCANGAAYKVAPATLWELGADVVVHGDSPDGLNINLDCGSTSPNAMANLVRESGADMGISLDGDADRVLIADENGRLLDGDQLMATIVETWLEADRLRGSAVATVMSNLGLDRYLAGLGVELVRTPVGDRYVVERMRRDGCNVGGEQSGHIILSDYNTTGDGLIAALQMLAVMLDNDRSLSEVGRRFEPLPQVLRNVKVNGTPPLENLSVKKAILQGESLLADTGRVLIRPSGTEPIVRVMAEGEDMSVVTQVVDDIVHAIELSAP